MLLFCRRRDKTVWKSAWMTSAQIVEPTSSLAWADVIHADFQTVISRRLQNISTYLFCTAERMLRTVIMQNSRLIQACFPIKIDEVRIDRFCVRYDWWRRLQPTSSVSPVWVSDRQLVEKTDTMTYCDVMCQRVSDRQIFDIGWAEWMVVTWHNNNVSITWKRRRNVVLV